MTQDWWNVTCGMTLAFLLGVVIYLAHHIDNLRNEITRLKKKLI